MLARILPLAPPADWQADYRAARLTAADLLDRVGLTGADLPYGLAPAPDFALKVPPHFLSLIRRGDPHDPLLLQVLARADELVDDPALLTDPLEEAGFTPARGILRKYGSRALLLAAGSCAIHCRYCFRRHTDYGAMVLPAGGHAAAVAMLAADPAVEEVILSGGDPLTLADDRLAALLGALAAIPHLSMIRIHTRTLTAVPARVTPALLALLAGLGKPVVVVTHTNHANEIDDVVAAALGRLRGAGVTLLNQSVLLRGVNDSAAAIRAHALRLFAAGVLPYYMHLLDPVAGAGHFDVGRTEALGLEQALRDTLPGYLVPRFVREVPGRLAKTPIWQLAG
ncbi:KamA family radical SAM protein [Sandarakinorhabdus sp. DWP1-3-1]|uniref:KamA family radical SAM protein n=1 Tax=Sandarakinorhabdus sp. DWP1-3-1 TaxID=2804627 RepID=UPI003CF4E47A